MEETIVKLLLVVLVGGMIGVGREFRLDILEFSVL